MDISVERTLSSFYSAFSASSAVKTNLIALISWNFPFTNGIPFSNSGIDCFRYLLKMNARFACLLLFAVFGCLSSGSVYADDGSGKPDPNRFGKPLVRAWFPSTLGADQQEFLSQIRREKKSDERQATEALLSNSGYALSSRGELPQPDENASVKAGGSESLRDSTTSREGILIYYDPDGYRPEKGFGIAMPDVFPGHPWLKPVRFRKVDSRQEFEKEVRRRTGMDQEVSEETLNARENGFVFRADIKWIAMKSSLLDVGPYLDLTSTYWAYRDGYMFFGDFEEILTMDFPDPRTLSPKGADADRDVFVQVDLNSVLPRQKRILWELIRKHAERSLQQYDNEGDAEYAFRKSVGDLQLNLIQAITQDLESIQLGIDFASEEEPTKVELELVTRPRVNLEHYFGTAGIGTPSLAAFVEEPAAMTLATSWGLPERIVTTFEKFLTVVDSKLDEQQGWTIQSILASEELTQDLLETIRGNNQIAVKLKQTEHGFTLFGGMRIQNAERASKNLAILLQELTVRDGWGRVPVARFVRPPLLQSPAVGLVRNCGKTTSGKLPVGTAFYGGRRDSMVQRGKTGIRSKSWGSRSRGSARTRISRCGERFHWRYSISQ